MYNSLVHRYHIDEWQPWTVGNLPFEDVLCEVKYSHCHWITSGLCFINDLPKPY